MTSTYYLDVDSITGTTVILGALSDSIVFGILKFKDRAKFIEKLAEVGVLSKDAKYFYKVNTPFTVITNSDRIEVHNGYINKSLKVYTEAQKRSILRESAFNYSMYIRGMYGKTR